METSNSTNKQNKKGVLLALASVVAVIVGVVLLVTGGTGGNIRSSSDPTNNENSPNDRQELPIPSPPVNQIPDRLSQTIEVQLVADDKNRRFNIFVPGSYIRSNQPVPLIFVWHGLSQTAENVQRMFKMDEIAERENFIVVYPDGIGNSFDIFRVDIELNYDLQFAREILTYMKTNFNIKQSSIYSTGYSNGGLMSTLLACVFSTEFTAVAPYAGSFAAEVIDKCEPTDIVPYLEIHGTNDAVIPHDGSNAFTSVDDALDFWARSNNQDTNPIITEIEENTLLYDFQPDNIVRHYRFIGGTHFNMIDKFPAQGVIDFFKEVSDF